MMRQMTTDMTPAKWYGMIREQVKLHRESGKLASSIVSGDASTDEVNMKHWYAGTLLATDLLMAAEAYIESLLLNETGEARSQADGAWTPDGHGGLFFGLPIPMDRITDLEVSFQFVPKTTD